MILKACNLRTRVEIIMGAMEIKPPSHKIIEKLGPGTNNKKNNLGWIQSWRGDGELGILHRHVGVTLQSIASQRKLIHVAPPHGDKSRHAQGCNMKYLAPRK